MLIISGTLLTKTGNNSFEVSQRSIVFAVKDINMLTECCELWIYKIYERGREHYFQHILFYTFC